MVGIREDLRALFIQLSLAGMPNAEMMELYGYMTEEEGQLSLFEDDRIPEKLKTRTEMFLKRDLSKRKKVLETQCIQTLVVGDDFYPEKLALTPDPPMVIYALGNVELMAKPALSVVGARKHTDYGQRVCKKFVSQLASSGLVIISGLALGIDKLAHQATLDVGGETIAVLGNGIGDCYPRSNRACYEAIQSTGLILSEYPPYTSPQPFRFPERNRIIAALGDGVLVVEAKEKSGSLITARLAAEYGREVFAVCGNVDSIYSQGTNRLIFDGASIALSPEDILNHPVYQIKKKETSADLSQLSLEEKTLYDSIKDGNQNTEALMEQIGWNITDVLSVLTMLELKNLITGVDSNCIEIL
ncbi:DNA-processing protein DprA [Peptoniphilus sp. HCN-40583]|uniref:DNA-processing protein DprA n=1 Tax=Peptoniphilus sp. HCN-40583 TaxID=3134662 RepID=UPI0030BDF972